jgi:large subunit ribosomal protein L22
VATQATDAPVTVRAQARWVRTSARKARLVLEHVRGKRYVQAHAALTFSTRAVSRDILQILESAAANAEANLELEARDLVVDACFADEGPTAKRWQPRARGRANRIRKRTCHVTIVLRHDPLPEAAEGTRASRRGSAAEATIAASRRRRRKPDADAAAETTAMAGTAPLEGDAEATQVSSADEALDTGDEGAATSSSPGPAEVEAPEEADVEAPDTDAEPPEQPDSTDEPAEGSVEVEAAAEDDTADEAAEETKKPTTDEEA